MCGQIIGTFMEPEEALEATKDDFAMISEIAGEDPEGMRDAVERIISRYEDHRNDEGVDVFDSAVFESIKP